MPATSSGSFLIGETLSLSSAQPVSLESAPTPQATDGPREPERPTRYAHSSAPKKYGPSETPMAVISSPSPPTPQNPSALPASPTRSASHARPRFHPEFNAPPKN